MNNINFENDHCFVWLVHFTERFLIWFSLFSCNISLCFKFVFVMYSLMNYSK